MITLVSFLCFIIEGKAEDLAGTTEYERPHLSVSGGVRLCPEEKWDVGWEVCRPSKRVRTKPEAKHPSLAGLWYPASLYSCKYWNILYIKHYIYCILYIYIVIVTFSLHAHLEAFLQPAVLTLVPEQTLEISLILHCGQQGGHIYTFLTPLFPQCV